MRAPHISATIRSIVAAVLFAAVTGGTAIAETVELSWKNATENTDGTPIPKTGPGSLVQTTVYYSRCVGGDLGENPPARVVAPEITATSIDEDEPGDWCHRATHTNTYGNESDVSNLAVKVVSAPTPNPPSDLVVDESALTAYGVQKTHNRVNTYAVGTVPAGTRCDPTSSANGMYVVPEDLLIPYDDSDVHPEVIVAKCGSGG